MARQHFPKSKLLVNEFNTVILGQFTDNYLALIQLLQDRGLVDGIGEQGHFLERADVGEVKANLDKLGATEEQLDFPVVYASALNGYAMLDVAQPGTDMRPLFEHFVFLMVRRLQQILRAHAPAGEGVAAR